MTAFEVATGWLTGNADREGGEPGAPRVSTPMKALESLLVPALASAPCLVAFSGGRDSSAVLAVAMRLAKREGLSPPIAVTLRYPGDHDAHEDHWQELAIRHLRVADWEKIPAASSADLLGPVARESLRRHGLLWPPAHYTWIPLLRLARGGSLVTGDGGDEVFGPRRISPLARLATGRSLRNWREVAWAAVAVAPRPARRRIFAQTLQAQLARSWLRPAAQQRFVEALSADRAGEPLGWDESIQSLARTRAWRLGCHNQDLLAAGQATRIVRPLQEPVFLSALGNGAPPWGFPDRNAAMRRVFGCLVPDELLTRSSKAFFNRVVFGEESRAFVSQWNGDGVLHELVDVEVLRRFWRAPAPHALSFALLQAAWLATSRGHMGSPEYQPYDLTAHNR
jgi:Asparagine synthase